MLKPRRPVPPLSRVSTLVALTLATGCSSGTDAVLAAYATTVVSLQDDMDALTARVEALEATAPLSIEVPSPLSLTYWSAPGCTDWAAAFESSDAAVSWACQVLAPSDYCLAEQGRALGLVLLADEASDSVSVACR